jgi:uncharacterized protein (DUF2141 family)
MRNFFRYTIVGFVLLLFGTSCANQVAPTGGPKDVTPPKVLGSYPLNKSTNFKESKVRILFDEYVVLDNPAQQVVISPPMVPFPSFRVKGKELIIEFQDSLRSNTTYTINITAAVKDLTESNVLPDFQYVFSTGDYLDSFIVTGRVVEAEKGELIEGVLVLLYDVLEDSVVYKEKPYYFGRTNKDGSFRIENLKGGKYKVFAVKDENFNLKYDLPNEKIAFWPDPISVSEVPLLPLELRLFQEEVKSLQLIETFTSSRGFNQFIYSMPVKKVDIKPLLDTANFSGSIIEYNVSRDTVSHWYLYNTNGRSILLVTANDTLTDSVSVKSPLFTNDSLYKIGKPGLLTASSKMKRSTAPDVLELDRPFEFELNRPAQKVDDSKVYVLEDTINAVVPTVYFADSVKRKVAIGFSWKPGSHYKIVFLDSAIIDSYGLKSDSIGFEVIARKPEDYGAVTITVDSLEPSQQYLLEARIGDAMPVVVVVITGTTKFSKKYEKLVPGAYKVRIVRDANFNKQWDTGSYNQSRQPERVYMHPTPIDLKPNWEIEVEIEMEK